MTTRLPQPISLANAWVRLDPLVEADLPALARFLIDPEVYSSGYVMHRQPHSPADALALAHERFQVVEPPNGRGFGRLAFTVRLNCDSGLGPEGTIVGSTSLGDAHTSNQNLQLGWTLYGPRWWGSAVNPATKLLLLHHCFEDLGYRRVRLQTDRLNTRSQAAIAKLGATREGVLRQDTRREDCSFRDTVVFAILSEEWPQVRDNLEERILGLTRG